MYHHHNNTGWLGEHIQITFYDNVHRYFSHIFITAHNSISLIDCLYFRYCAIDATGVIVPEDCPAGYYCLPGTETKYASPCPPGTFSNVTSLEVDTQCLPCTSGYFCGTGGK